MILLQAVFLSVISLTNSVDASMRFRGRDIRDVVREVNTSSSFGYFSECGEFSADTQVLFNDTVAGGEGPCAGDAGFLYGKSVDHASLGPDASIDKTFSPDNYNNYFSGTYPTMLVMPDIRGNWGTAQANGIEIEFKSTPSGTEGFDNVILNGVTSRFVADGSAGSTAETQNIVDILSTSNHFNALTQVRGTGSVDEVDLITGTSLNSEFLINLSGTGTNDVENIIWETVSDEATITSDTLNATFTAHNQDLDFNIVSSSTNILNSGFIASTDISATGSTDAITHTAFSSNLIVTSADPTSNIAEHYEADSTYSSSASTGDNSIIDFGYTYFPAINGDTADVAVSIGLDTHQIISIEALDDGPGAPSPHLIGLADSLAGNQSVPRWSMYGWHATQDIGLSNDSGTFDTMRGIDLEQRWGGDASGTTVDGIYIEGLEKAGTGTVTTATDINLVAPVRTAGTLTNAYTIQLTTPTTGGTENAGLRFANGIADLIEFEGNTVNASELRFSVTEPTADRTQTFQDLTGTVALTASAVNAADFIVDFPAAQTIAAGNTITANACGSLKLITASGAVITDTTNTFTAPAAANKGCILHVCNTGANNITLDNNANFKSAGAADVVMTQDDCVLVGSTGSGGVWYQLTGLEAN